MTGWSRHGLAYVRKKGRAGEKMIGNVKKKGIGERKKVIGIMVAPTAIVLSILGIIPILFVMWFSLNDVNPVTLQTEFAGIRNFAEIFTAKDFWQALGITFYFTIVSVILQIVLGITVAFLLNQNIRGRALIRTVAILPWAVPTYVNANLWKWIFNTDYGILNKILLKTGLISKAVFWLGEPILALNAIIVADTWRMLPMVALMVLAALQNVSSESLEAASLDGANAWKRLRYIYLPAIRPMIVVTLVLRTIQAFRVFDIIYSITKGGPNNGTMVVSFYAYDEIFKYLHYGKGAAISLVILVIMLFITLIYMKLLQEKD